MGKKQACSRARCWKEIGRAFQATDWKVKVQDGSKNDEDKHLSCRGGRMGGALLTSHSSEPTSVHPVWEFAPLVVLSLPNYVWAVSPLWVLRINHRHFLHICQYWHLSISCSSFFFFFLLDDNTQEIRWVTQANTIDYWHLFNENLTLQPCLSNEPIISHVP